MLGGVSHLELEGGGGGLMVRPQKKTKPQRKIKSDFLFLKFFFKPKP